MSPGRPEPPPLLWFNGSVVPWDAGVVHVWSEYAQRGASVFEGVRAYWAPGEERLYGVAVDEHLRRLDRSARLSRFPGYAGPDTFRRAIDELTDALGLRADAYLRPTVYIAHGRYGYRPDEVEMGAFVVGFPVGPPPRSVSCAVSSWRRVPDTAFPPLVKSGAAYQTLRLPIIEARQRGFDDVILLNDRGLVAEASGAVVFLVTDGEVTTPPVSAGNLDSITGRYLTELLARDFGRTVRVRDVSRTELHLADEVFLAGTLAEVQPVVRIDDLAVGDGTPGPLTSALRERYGRYCRNGDGVPAGWLTPLGAGV